MKLKAKNDPPKNATKWYCFLFFDSEISANYVDSKSFSPTQVSENIFLARE